MLDLVSENRTAQGYLASICRDPDRARMADQPANFRSHTLDQNNVGVVGRDETIAKLGEETTPSLLEIFAAYHEGTAGLVQQMVDLVASEGSSASPVVRIEEIHRQNSHAGAHAE
jgi:hypothetical protein